MREGLTRVGNGMFWTVKFSSKLKVISFKELHLEVKEQILWSQIQILNSYCVHIYNTNCYIFKM